MIDIFAGPPVRSTQAASAFEDEDEDDDSDEMFPDMSTTHEQLQVLSLEIFGFNMPNINKVCTMQLPAVEYFV